ncbi:MAG: hypothetical protein QMD13_09370 [Candidatus Bathyarchaeia archaeon]|nr:hypothetical protein [Candidatus Bathyarchaeia archaeon]
MSEGYYRDPKFCLECAYQHARDTEHHLEDWLKFTKKEEQRKTADELRRQQRVLRKKIDEWRIKLETENPETENPEIPEECTFTKEQVKPKQYFDPASFRVICPECPEKRCSLCPPELACATRIVIGCQKGQFIKGKCRIGTETHVVYHGKGGEKK